MSTSVPAAKMIDNFLILYSLCSTTIHPRNCYTSPHFLSYSTGKRTFPATASTISSSYTNNPYGSRVGLCDGLSAELKRVTRRRLLLGVSLGYEALRSRLNITSINVFNGVDAYSLAAYGRTTLTSRFLNLSPSIGYRFLPGKLIVDLTVGLDLGYCLGAEENGKAAATNGATFYTAQKRQTITDDIRQRLQVSVRYHKTAVYVGYSHGLSNYLAGYVGGTNEASSQLLRFGIQYWVW